MDYGKNVLLQISTRGARRACCITIGGGAEAAGCPKGAALAEADAGAEAETGRGVPSKEPHSGNDKVSWCEEDHTAAGTQTWIAGADKEQVAANQNAATCSIGHEDLGKRLFLKRMGKCQPVCLLLFLTCIHDDTDDAEHGIDGLYLRQAGSADERLQALWHLCRYDVCRVWYRLCEPILHRI